MKTYEKYKPSGIEWIGDIPEHWEIRKLRFVGRFTASGIDKKINEDEPTVKMINYTDVYGNFSHSLDKSRTYMEVTCPRDKQKEHAVKKGDLIFTPSSETVEDIGLSALVNEDLENTVYSYHVLRLRFEKEFDHNFKKYLCNNHFVLNQFSSAAKGTTRQILNREQFNSAVVLIPPISEQTTIAGYLDKKTAEINKLIANKKRLIELLKEERITIINQAITKGIYADAKLKPSGINWLGDIPEYWQVKKLKYLGSFQNGISEGADYFGLGYPFVNYGDVYKNTVLPFNVDGLANSTISDRKRFSVKKGDIFFTRTSETVEEIGIGSTCFQTIENATFSGFLIRFRPDKDIFYLDFAKYYFRSQIQRVFFVKEMNLVTRASLSQDLLKRLPVLLPSITEQKEIADFLDEKTNEIDSTISKIEKEIELIKEYRTALISEVVTGKIEVE